MVRGLADPADYSLIFIPDSQVRTELETRLMHLQPAELLLPASGLSKATEKVLNHFAGHTKYEFFT
jgi:DNA mismatch repair ATPase MutS